MSHARVRLVACALALSLASSAAYAGGAEDGEAGLDALNQGNYDQAISLFTRALADRRLVPEDRVLAYVSRGQAYLEKGDGRDAAADFEQALRLKPGNTEAKDGLEQAAALRTSTANPKETASWGFLEQTVGTCWVTNPAHPKSYGCSNWDPSRTVVIDKEAGPHAMAIAKARLDPVAGIVFGETAGSLTLYGTIDVSGNTVVTSSYLNNTPTRETVTYTSATTGTDVSEKYQNGAWGQESSYPIQEVSKETVASVRWAKKILQ
jgi:tetratricopeptide (TPR) repeat protein